VREPLGKPANRKAAGAFCGLGLGVAYPRPVQLRRPNRRAIAIDNQSRVLDIVGELHGELQCVAALLHDWMVRSAAEDNRTRELGKEVAMLRGELRGMREDRRSDNVVEIPRAGWKHDAA